MAGYLANTANMLMYMIYGVIKDHRGKYLGEGPGKQRQRKCFQIILLLFFSFFDNFESGTDSILTLCFCLCVLL